ncbi:putative methyltransferase C9orf114 isoform X1 [Amphibalanus amphitrite]|uniref:putative methyltransferase C9orf114 isoform X1 n=1 Tax=Amphibalanus amphitrite TaxID=1232801 RepID=UPI001C914C7E|nr:putative methyltransferase C9orf114 isoform X1 [Amphibalanus amphitrite]
MGKVRAPASPDAGEAAHRRGRDSGQRPSKEERKKWRELRLLKHVEKHRQLKERAAAAAAGGGQTAPLSFPAAPGAGRGVSRTLALAVPGSILENAQSRELRAYLAGQVARAAAVFCVDEVVVFNDQGAAALRPGAEGSQLRAPECCEQLSRLLQYMECPQYLRKLLFPVHEDLRFAGLLNPLDCPHHLRRTEESEFREGVVADLPAVKGRYSLVNIGLTREVRADRLLEPGVRVTLRLDPDGRRGTVVPPRTPRIEMGTYWGYSVRMALSLADVFAQCLHPGGYDLLLGTSDKGDPLDQLELPAAQHALIVFGGVQGLEAALENDEKLTLDDPADLFDLYVNSCPGQGSRTIRTEEAILITLAALHPRLLAADRGAAGEGSGTAGEENGAEGGGATGGDCAAGEGGDAADGSESSD